MRIQSDLRLDQSAFNGDTLYVMADCFDFHVTQGRAAAQS